MAGKTAILSVRILGDAKDAMSAMTKSSLGVAAMGAAFAAAAAVAGKALYDIGSEFNGVSRDIIVGTGASGDALDGLMDSVKTIGTTVPVSFGDAGEAVASLNTQLGATGPPLEEMTSSILDASRLMGEDGVTNADAFGRAMKQWQRPAEDGASILDELFVGTQQYGIGLNDTIGYLKNYGATLQNAGFSMEEAASLFGQLESGGIQVTRIMPGLNSAFRTWASEGKNVQEELGKTVDAIAAAETSTEGLAIATEAFGAEGAQRMTTAIRSGVLELGELDGALGDTTNAIAETSAATMTAGDHWTLLKNTALAALEPIGTAIFDGVGYAMSHVTELIQGMDFSRLEELGAMITPMIEGAADALFSLFENGTPASALLEELAPQFDTIGQLLSDLAPLLGELGEAFMSLVGEALSALLPLVMELAESVLPVLVDLFGSLAPVILDVADAVIPLVGDALGALLPVVLELVDAVLPALLDVLPPIADAITELLPAILPVVEAIASELTPVIEILTPLIVTLIETLVSMLVPALEIVVGAVQVVAGILTGDFTAAWEGAKNIVTGAMNLIKAQVTGGINNVKAVVTAGLALVVNLFTSTWSRVTSSAQSAAQSLGSAVQGGVSTVVSLTGSLPGRVLSAMGNLGSLLLGSGRALMQGFARGIRNGISSAINAARDAVSAVRNFFPFSPAKQGPFSGSGYTTTSGRTLVKDFASAMTSELGTVTRAARRVATAGTFEGGFSLTPAPAYSAAGGGPAVVIEQGAIRFDGIVTDPEATGRALVDALDGYFRRRGVAWRPK